MPCPWQPSLCRGDWAQRSAGLVLRLELRRAVLKGGKKRKRKGFVTPTKTNVHGDALCFMVILFFKGWRLAVGGWWLVAVVGGWWLAVGGWRRLAAVGSWQLVVRGAVLKGCPEQKKKSGFFRRALELCDAANSLTSLRPYRPPRMRPFTLLRPSACHRLIGQRTTRTTASLKPLWKRREQR